MPEVGEVARILIASDVTRTRISITGALTRAGHTVDRVNHLRLAGEYADIHDMDVILIDLDHPFQQQQLVASIRARSDIPIVVLLDTFRAWAATDLSAQDVVVLTHPVTDDGVVTQLEAMLPSEHTHT